MKTITPELLLNWFVKDFKKIVLFGAVFSVIAVVYALSIPNQYSSKVVVASADNKSKSMAGSLGGSLGSLASMAGVSLGGGEMSPEVLSEIVQSPSFLAEFIRHNNLEPVVMAAIGYKPEAEAFEYDSNVYDPSSGKWTREYFYPQTLQPNDSELAEKFKESLSVSYARKTKLVSISLKSFAPEFSADTLTKLIKYFNNYMRQKDMADSQSNIDYLTKELASAKYTEVNLALQQLIEEQFKTLAIAKTREEYVFRTVESPLPAAKKSEPKRAVICLVIAFFGTLFSTIVLWSVRLIRDKEA